MRGTSPRFALDDEGHLVVSEDVASATWRCGVQALAVEISDELPDGLPLCGRCFPGGRVCRKLRYASEAEALQRIFEIALNVDGSRSAERPNPIRAYRHRRCSAWHITSAEFEKAAP